MQLVLPLTHRDDMKLTSDTYWQINYWSRPDSIILKIFYPGAPDHVTGSSRGTAKLDEKSSGFPGPGISLTMSKVWSWRISWKLVSLAHLLIIFCSWGWSYMKLHEVTWRNREQGPFGSYGSIYISWGREIYDLHYPLRHQYHGRHIQLHIGTWWADLSSICPASSLEHLH